LGLSLSLKDRSRAFRMADSLDLESGWDPNGQKQSLPQLLMILRPWRSQKGTEIMTKTEFLANQCLEDVNRDEVRLILT
jgi:hypothetical protein